MAFIFWFSLVSSFENEKNDAYKMGHTLNVRFYIHWYNVINIQVILIHKIVPHHKSNTQHMLINKLTSKIYDKCVHLILAFIFQAIFGSSNVVHAFPLPSSPPPPDSITSLSVWTIQKWIPITLWPVLYAMHFCHDSTISKNYIIFYSLYPII